MEGAVYDISDWAACQSDNLKHLQANTHNVQYRIVSGKKNPPSKNTTPEFPRWVQETLTLGSWIDLMKDKWLG